MLVSQTADGFRATVSTLRSLDESKGVRFHTFSLPDGRCVCLMVKNLGRQIPEDVVRQELETLGSSVEGVLQIRSARREQKASKTRPITPHFYCVSSAGDQKWRNCILWSNSAVCESQWRRTSPQKVLCSAIAATLRPYAAVLRLCTPVSEVHRSVPYKVMQINGSSHCYQCTLVHW
jgi:hypothetical protein